MQGATLGGQRSDLWTMEFFGIPQLLFAIPYVSLLAWFHGVDVYHHHFSESGLIVVVYNLFRVLFIFYLFWMVATVGLLLLHVVARHQLAFVSLPEQLALGFFTGAGIWHVVMFLLGFLDLYTVPVAVLLTLPPVILAYAPARATAIEIRRNLARTGERDFAPLDRLLSVLIGIVFVALLLTKGLYPSGGHDYFTHYFYFLQAVIKNRGLWPNEVWYHFYYSKGAGLFFLGILVTDPLAPQLVTFCFIMAAALALFLILNNVAPRTLWPPVGIILFFGIYICTPGSAVLYQANGGWGDFEKLHEIVAALAVAVVWSTLEALSSTNGKRIMFLVVATSAIICAVLVDITIAIFFGGLFALLILFYAAVRQPILLRVCLGLATVAGGTFIAILTINQLTTGLADDQGLLFFWHYANVEKLSHWGALPFVILTHLGRQSQQAAGLQLLSIHTVIFLIESFRLDLVAPLVLGGMIATLPLLFRGYWNRSLGTLTVVLAATVLTFIALALIFGRAQQVSFYRYASFATGPAIICGIIGWNLARSDTLVARISRTRLVAIVVLLVCVYYGSYPQLALSALDRGLDFASGRYSIDSAYTAQYGPPPRLDWTAIYAGARGAYDVVGPGTPIWSFHIHTYCMLPDCLVESFPSFLMTRHWDRVMFGTPDEAKQTLHVAHFDYFLFCREDGIRDPLPLSPLFSPDNIADYLGIRWTDGTTALLTWLGPGVLPLDQSWIADYRRATQQSGAVQSFPFQAMKGIYAALDATPHPWRSFKLPWQRD